MKRFGLTSQQVEDSLRKHGNNTLSQPPRDTFWDKLLENFKDPIIRILIFAFSLICFFILQSN